MPTVIDTVAWVHVENGRVLGTRSREKDVYYIPGGKRENGESDLQTLLREVGEELTVSVLPETAVHLGTYEAQAHGHPDGVTVRMSCYTGDYRGTLTPSNEIADVVWLTHADRNSTPPVDRLVLDDLRARGELS
ncbi:ADP-ribose pyrophosphatase YjhB (NUDIX family) [Haloactinospora alba]|uniref:ADP-ribose pyrophosphatase YjhB (NUDIX family) n=1 Tax=Haloactinospora alba TaxID=405555 RepID=A0A543N9R9_9ACTN|nr:NUDIX domain-containing protein [Haloactinospora alba]TQN28548.1 ADP-ribose pyrophosphatase YjhB (NUDIX family) [Haloactinospora alba]